MNGIIVFLVSMAGACCGFILGNWLFRTTHPKQTKEGSGLPKDADDKHTDEFFSRHFDLQEGEE